MSKSPEVGCCPIIQVSGIHIALDAGISCKFCELCIPDIDVKIRVIRQDICHGRCKGCRRACIMRICGDCEYKFLTLIALRPKAAFITEHPILGSLARSMVAHAVKIFCILTEPINHNFMRLTTCGCVVGRLN